LGRPFLKVLNLPNKKEVSKIIPNLKNLMGNKVNSKMELKVLPFFLPNLK